MPGLVDACLQSEKLVEWYWKFGRRRTHHQITPSWLIELYEQRDAAKAISVSEERSDRRRSLAVWGPSQSGKSMLLSRFLDSANESGSALTWNEGELFRFKPSNKFPDIDTFNPRKNGTDASGCVTRFYLAEQVADPDHPIEIRLSTRRQILQAITAGYIVECRQELPGGRFVEIDEDFIRAELAPDRVGTPEQDAVEHMVDVVSVIDRMLPDEYTRFNKLKRSNIWHQELRGALVADLALASSRERAIQLGRKLLWDNRQKLNELADKLERYLDSLEAKFGGKRVTCSLAFAARVIDIDTYGILAGDVSESREKVQGLKMLLKQTTYVDYPDRVVIGADEKGKVLFRSEEEFGLLQGLIWELAVPLNAKYFRDRPELSMIFSLLGNTEILDVPGVAKDQPGPDHTMFDLESDKPASELLSKVLKRGRTATIINRYAEQLRVDGVLLLNVAGEPPAQPKLLIPGIEAIWRAAQADYLPASGDPPPVPLAICLTFMGQKINLNVRAGIDGMNLGTFESTLSKFGDLARPGVSQLFVTTYPDVPGAELSPEARTPAVREAVLRQSWIAERFITAPEKDSWRALFEDDGGVEHLLRSVIGNLSTSSRDRRIAVRAREISKELLRLTQMAIPVRDVDGRRHGQILTELVSRLKGDLANSRPAQDAASTLSWQLRRLMSFEAQDIEPLPQRFNRDASRFEAYVKAQIDKWAGRPGARQVLSEMGVSDSDQIVLLDALRRMIDVKSVASWAQAKMGPIDTERQTVHMRRYLAAKCAELLVGKALEINDEPRDKVALTQQRHAKFNAWIKRERPEDTPHFEASVAPLLQRLADIAKLQVTMDWEDQPGDDEIEVIMSRWTEMETPKAAGARA
jgi:hypothetical protein